MTPNALQKLREWLTIEEAARELSVALSDHVSEADVLRLAIDGNLKLSVYLPSKVTARCQRIDDEAIEPPEKDEKIQGLCDLPMLGRAKLQVEHDYHWLRNRTFVPLDGPVGALVELGDLICKLPADRGESGMWPKPQSEFPSGSVLAVRRTALESFVAQHAPVVAPSSPGVVEKPLGERERATLLTIIAALAQSGGIDVTKPAKAAETIEALTVDIGARVSARSVADHLNRIPDALERRRKDSS